MVRHLRSWVRRLERAGSHNMIHIPQMDGSVATFTHHEARQAFLNTHLRLEGADVPTHPMTEAAMSSADPRWALSFFADVEDVGPPVEDLSDP